MPIYVLDTSAILAVLQDEPGKDQVLDLFLEVGRGDIVHERSTINIPFMALMEVHYLALQRLGWEEAEKTIQVLRAWPAEVHESTPRWRLEAAAVKASNRLSAADAWNASLALLLDAELVHKDPEFDEVAGLRSLRLPGK